MHKLHVFKRTQKERQYEPSYSLKHKKYSNRLMQMWKQQNVSVYKPQAKASVEI